MLTQFQPCATYYHISGNFRGMYISRLAVESRFSRIKFRGWAILPLKFPYLTHVFARQVCMVINFHGLNFHCGSFDCESRENYKSRTFPGIRYVDAIILYRQLVRVVSTGTYFTDSNVSASSTLTPSCLLLNT